MSIINVAIVDEYNLFVSGLKSLINGFGNYKVLLEAKDFKNLINKMACKCIPEIVIIGWNRSSMENISDIVILKNNYPGIDLIVISNPECEESLFALLKLEIKGFVSMQSKPEEFRAALETVTGGSFYYPAYIARQLIRDLSKRAENEQKIKLNERELEFLKLSASDLTYKEIADRLNVSVRTVDGYRDHLFKKLHVKSRVGLALYAVRNKLKGL